MLDLDGTKLHHSEKCKGARISRRPAYTRPGWTVVHCECCHAIAVEPDPPTAQLDFEDGSP